MGITEIIIAIIGVVSGGGLSQLIQLWLNGGKSYRQELKEDVADTRNRIDKLEEENDLWKVKYFDLVFAIKSYRLKVLKLAVEHNLPTELIEQLKEDTDLDQIMEQLKKA